MLTCPRCGNADRWNNPRQVDGQQTATCGDCGQKVTSTGGVQMGNVTGGMTQVVTRKN